jgi:ferric citrate transport system substrate-binding protein
VSRRIGALALFVAAGAMTFAGAGISSTAKKPKQRFDPTCGKARTASRTVDGTLGSMTISGTPKRVVALEFSFVDALAAVGLKPVGIADDNDPARIIPPLRSKVAGYTSVGTRAAPSLEKIASLHPDLIVADADRHATIYKQLQNIAPTIALDSLKQAYLPGLHAALVVGQAVNKCGAMRVRIAQDRAVMARIAKAVPNEKRNAMFVVTTNKVFNVHDSLAYTPSLLSAIGIKATLQVKQGGNPYQELTMESLISANPDILFIAQNPPSPTTDQNFAKSPLWGQLQAVKNHKVYYVNTNLWSKARGMLAGELIAQQAVHLLYDKYVPIKLPNVSVVKGS